MKQVRRLALLAVLGAFSALMLTAAPALSATFDVAAHTSLDRTYSWTIHKVAHNPSITLTPGGSFVETYDVTASGGQ